MVEQGLSSLVLLHDFPQPNGLHMRGREEGSGKNTSSVYDGNTFYPRHGRGRETKPCVQERGCTGSFVVDDCSVPSSTNTPFLLKS